MFKVLGVLVAIYTAHAAFRGAVFARSGAWGRSITRSESPRYSWVVISVYAALSVALVTIF